jgi:RES domain-containing protein
VHSWDELLRKLPGLPRVTAVGPWSRAVGFHLLLGPPPGAPPGPPQPLWPGGPAIHGARFTPRGTFDSLYLSSDAGTALREVSAVFETFGAALLYPLTAFGVDGVVTDILDLTDAATQTQLGTNPKELTGDWAVAQEMYLQGLGGLPPTQLLGKAAYECLALLGLKYPSAKNPKNGTNYVMFPDRLPNSRTSHLEVIDSQGNLRQTLP